MNDHQIKRLSRLTSIITQLQTKRLVTAVQLSQRFEVSIRTIYRDIRSLEQAGVPILTSDGKGYMLSEGYKVPPVMFTENEAHALVTAERLMLNGTDQSLSKEFTAAVNKVKAVLQYSTKEKIELLSDRIVISPAITGTSTSGSLIIIQNALTSFRVLKITYHSVHQQETTEREVEPFALYYSLQESWLLIAYCRLRKDFRMFRLDRILTLNQTDLAFEPHQLTLARYLEEKKKNFNTPDIPLS